MSLVNSLALDLLELPVEPLAPTAWGASLESVAVAHGMTEMAASCIGSPLLICSCCCCCAG